MSDVKEEYRRAYGDWEAQVAGLHRVVLDGERLEPPKLKALLNREARAFERFEVARRRLLGLSG